MQPHGSPDTTWSNGRGQVRFFILERCPAGALGIDRLWRTWSPRFTLDDDHRRELHACLASSMPAPIGYYRALRHELVGTPLRRRLATHPITTPVLQLHGADDGCIVPPSRDDTGMFGERVLEVIPYRGHFLQLEDPVGIGERITAWLGQPEQPRM